MNLFIDVAGHGPDLVMLHGWGMHGGIFHRVRNALTSHYRTYCVDLPGHGASAPVKRFVIASIVECLARKFAAPVHVLGWSLGGAIAQYWAYRYPTRVKSLILVASSPVFAARPDWPYAPSADDIVIMGRNLHSDFKNTLERFLALQMLGTPNAREMLKTLGPALFSRGCPQGVLSALEVLLALDHRSIIGEITCPVGVFHGKRDVITPIGAGHWLMSHLRYAQWYEFKHAAHLPFLSDEALFLEQLTFHMSQHE